MKKLTILGLAAISVVLVGCNGGSSSGYQPKPPQKTTPATVAAGQEATLFPFVKGNQWVYTVEAAVRDQKGLDHNANSELTFTIVDVQPYPQGGQLASLEITQEGKMVDKQTWLLNDKGLYQVTIGFDDAARNLKLRTFTPPQPVIVFPVKPNTKFNWEGTGPIGAGETTSKLEGTIGENLDVDTAMGKLNAIAIEQKQTWTLNGEDGKMTTNSWWVPKIGLVRLWQQVEGAGSAGITKIQLKSKTLKE